MQIAKWLQANKQVVCSFDTAVTAMEGRTVIASDGRTWTADRIVICSGSDLQTLFPDVLQNAGLRLCKLQMLKAKQKFSVADMLTSPVA